VIHELGGLNEKRATIWVGVKSSRGDNIKSTILLEVLTKMHWASNA